MTRIAAYPVANMYERGARSDTPTRARTNGQSLQASRNTGLGRRSAFLRAKQLVVVVRPVGVGVNAKEAVVGARRSPFSASGAAIMSGWHGSARRSVRSFPTGLLGTS